MLSISKASSTRQTVGVGVEVKEYGKRPGAETGKKTGARGWGRAIRYEYGGCKQRSKLEDEDEHHRLC